MAQIPQLDTLNPDAVEDWVALVYELCKPEIRKQRMNDQQAVDYIAAVSDHILTRLQHQRPAAYAKFKRAMTRH